MYKALYKYKATYPSALSFSVSEVFVEVAGATTDHNWYYVVNSVGKSGFIPRNYTESLHLSSSEQLSHVTEVLRHLADNSSINSKDKKETKSKLEKVKASISEKMDQTPDSPVSFKKSPKSTGSRESLNSVRSSKKRAAPQPPNRSEHRSSDHRSGSECSEQSAPSPRASPRPPSSGCGGDDKMRQEVILEDRASSHQTEDKHLHSSLQIPGNSDISKFSHQTSISSVSTDSAVADLVTVTYSHPQESCRAKALELVEMMRVTTDMSHSSSTLLLQRILQDLVASRKDLNVLVPSLLNELKVADLFSDDTEIISTSDYASLCDILDQLTKAKDDEQQRNWMLYEDDEIITDNLRGLETLFRNASQEISKKVISRYKYTYVQNLIEYYQMETRWNIRKYLIEVFTMMASIDKTVISVMLNSVLPLELVQDMFEKNEDSERLKHSAILLTVIFSQGESFPIHYTEQLGARFVSFILTGLEDPRTSDFEAGLPDIYMGLLSSYNLQFQESSTNILLKTLAEVTAAKMFTEKLLLLLNRDDDPAQILGGPREGLNSIQKLVLDVFSNDDCISHFYTNDLMVLIDIIARQLCDLGPGVERYTYLEMAHLVLARSGYEEHLHRLGDLQVCLHRIQKEEGQSVDKIKVEEICKSFTCFKI